MNKSMEEKEKEMAKKKDIKKIEVERFPTGSSVLDCILSEGRDTPSGYPIKVMGLESESMAGKTRLALEMIYEAYKSYGKDNVEILFLDGESGMSIDTESCYGFTLTHGGNIKSIKTLEQLQVETVQFCRNKDPKKLGIVIWDSVDAFTTASTESNYDERAKQYKKDGDIKAIKTYGMEKPKLLSEMMPMITSEADASRTLVLAIQQVRENINAGPFGKKTRTSGGKAIRFYTSVGFGLRRADIFGEKDREIGYLLELTGIKTRTKYERRKAYIVVNHETGFDAVKSDLIFLYDLVADNTKLNVPKSKALKWDAVWDSTKATEEADAVTSEEYKEFIKDNDLADNIKEEYGNLIAKNVKAYINDTPEVQALFIEKFGVMDLDTLCSYIEKNNLEEELAWRVKDKFFSIEEALQPKDRKSRKL